MDLNKNDVLKKLILDINNSDLNTIKKYLVNKTFELRAHPYLTSDLSGWIGALTVRAILHELNVNEHHIFKWKPENKYNQYLILNHYAPGCMSKTLSLQALLKNANWVTNIRKLIKADYFIKATLGFGSGRTMNFDRTSEFEQILEEYQDEILSGDQWILQKKLKLSKEFRIHTFGRDIIYGLTVRISGESESEDFDRAQEFLSQILYKLPASFLEGTLIGWDIGLTKKGKHYVIEANFTGYHQAYSAGFQTTGYVDTPPFGPAVCAWLHTWFRNKYAVAITSVESILLEKFEYLEEFSYYISILKNEHAETLSKAKGRVTAIYIYLEEDKDYYIIKLVTYFQIANFADTFYLITNQKQQQKSAQLFTGQNLIHVDERSLFTEDQYEEVKLMDQESRRKICFEHAINLQAGQSYLII